MPLFLVFIGEYAIGDACHHTKSKSGTREDIEDRKDFPHRGGGDKTGVPHCRQSRHTEIESIDERESFLGVVEKGAGQKDKQSDDKDRLKVLVFKGMEKSLCQSSNCEEKRDHRLLRPYRIEGDGYSMGLNGR